MVGLGFYSPVRPQTQNRASIPVVPRERVMGPGQSEREELLRLRSTVADLRLANTALRARLRQLQNEIDQVEPAPTDESGRLYRSGDLLRLVAKVSGLTVREIKSARRHKTTCKVRHVACWAVHHFTLMSSTDIGRAIGGRDHTSILHALRRVSAVIAGIPDFDATHPEHAIRQLLAHHWFDQRRPR